MSFLEIRNVSKSFGGINAIRNISLDIKQRECLGLIGPNGSGKTTLFNVIHGVYKADSGTIAFKTQNLVGLKTFQISALGIARTFQIPKPFVNLSLFENVLIAAWRKHQNVAEASDAASKALDFVGLSRKASLKAADLTHADRRFLELARALTAKPDLIMLDEVMAGLNPTETQHAIDLIDKILDSGITLFIIEHVMSVIMSVSDRIVVLDHGSKIAEGTPTEVSKDEKVISAYLGEEFKNA